MSDANEYLTVSEASAMLGVKRETLYAYVSRGVLKSYRQGVGRQRLYRRDEVEALLTVRADQPAPAQPLLTPQKQKPTAPALPDDTFRDVDLPNAETWAGDH